MKLDEIIKQLSEIREKRGNIKVLNVKGGEPGEVLEITESQLVPDVWEVYVF
ncbi:MAG: hypothetical protein A4E27_00165 [Methanobacterium sp. PtaU1.Bin242]|nr:MAG: hypothetical protein A4E27_00165 [Methanobacterium sp. PtaU1.Bin242]